MSELPEDLLEEILCRVPAASFKRLRSTCKRWNRLFNDKRFTRKHFDKAKKQSLILMLKRSTEINSVRLIMRTNLHRFSPEKLSVTDLRSSLDQPVSSQVSHCDGSLLCHTKEYNSRLVVWNPCTGQTRYINPRNQYTTYALGSYRDKISNDISYKILSKCDYGDKEEIKIYEINSTSWRRILDVTLDFSISEDLNCGVSLKGKTYLIARDKKEEPQDKFLLVSFDYTTERFERLCLPHHFSSYRILSLSVVREEKLSVLLQRDGSSKTEIWVTNKIGDETKLVSWSMVLALDLGPRLHTGTCVSFWINEEKRVLVCCENVVYYGKYKKIYIVGEDNKVRTENLEVGQNTLPVWLNYVPSLIQIQQN